MLRPPGSTRTDTPLPYPTLFRTVRDPGSLVTEFQDDTEPAAPAVRAELHLHPAAAAVYEGVAGEFARGRDQTGAPEGGCAQFVHRATDGAPHRGDVGRAPDLEQHPAVIGHRPPFCRRSVRG